MFGKRADELNEDENNELDAALHQYDEEPESSGSDEDYKAAGDFFDIGGPQRRKRPEEAAPEPLIEHAPVIVKGAPTAKKAARARKFMRKLKYPARLATYHRDLPAMKRAHNEAIRARRSDPSYTVPSDEEDTEYEIDEPEDEFKESVAAWRATILDGLKLRR
jgi:hypothetical protein